MTAPPMAYFGGKTQLAARIAAMLPPHEHYVEPFAGSLAVLLAKKPSRMETVNDLDGDLMAFWRVLREQPGELARVCALTPHSRAEAIAARELVDDDVEQARRIWVRITQARTGTLRKTGWRYYINPAGSGAAMPEYLEAYVDRMATAAERLHHVSLECRPAIELVRAYGAFPECCLYVDPPYLGSTRHRNYQTEMTSPAEHTELLDALCSARASVVLSGYTNALYNTALAGWHRIEIATISGHAKPGNYERTEVIWSNRAALPAMHLFDLEEGFG